MNALKCSHTHCRSRVSPLNLSPMKTDESSDR